MEKCVSFKFVKLILSYNCMETEMVALQQYLRQGHCIA